MGTVAKRTRGGAPPRDASDGAVARREPPRADLKDFAFLPATRAVRRNITAYQLNNRIFFRLFQLGNQLQRQAVQQLGITTVQWAVLGALSQPRFSAGIPLSDLGEYLLVTRQNLDGVLKRLERDGLVQRVSDDNDRRSRLVQLTLRGQRYWAETVERIGEFYEQAAENFSFDDRVALVHYMNLLQKDLAQVKLERASLPKRRRRGR